MSPSILLSLPSSHSSPVHVARNVICRLPICLTRFPRPDYDCYEDDIYPLLHENMVQSQAEGRPRSYNLLTSSLCETAKLSIVAQGTVGKASQQV